MSRKNMPGTLARLLMLLVFIYDGVTAAVSDSQNRIVETYRVMHPEACRKVEEVSPPEEKIDAIEFFERRYMDIDGDGICEIIDVWIDRVTTNWDDYRLSSYSDIYKIRDNQWKKIKKSEASFDYFPKHQIQNKINNIIYYIFDFRYRGNTPVFIDAYGIKYLDEWRDDKKDDKIADDGLYGIKDCGFPVRPASPRERPKFECDGQSFSEIIKVLLQK